MLIDAVKRCMLRDLGGLTSELDAYPDDASVWVIPTGVKNSTGTLAVHIAGNLRHFIGGVIGKSGYVRNRDAEFAVRDLPRVELELLLAVTRDEVVRGLDSITDADLPNLPLVQFGSTALPAHVALVHLAVHLTYHLGQADYHRRLVTGDTTALSIVPLPPLADPVIS